MKKSTIAVLVPVLSLLTAVSSQILTRQNSQNFLFGLSSEFWSGFVISAGIGLMLVLLSVYFFKSKDAE